MGRERELAAARALLAKTRLLTLLGTGGLGKTRLSLQIAAEVLDDYPDGVWLVELAALTDARLVPQAVGSVLGVKEEAGGDVLEEGEVHDPMISRRGVTRQLELDKPIIAAINGDAIGLAIKAFENSKAQQRMLVLLTDGNDTASRVPPAHAAEIAQQRGLTIYTIGVGDPQASGENRVALQVLRDVASHGRRIGMGIELQAPPQAYMDYVRSLH